MANAEIVELYPSVENQVSPEEWEMRVNLAACYRLVDLYDMSDMTRTHISARVPGEDTFLLNPYGLMFNEITASSLIKVDQDGNELDNNGPYKINPAGFTIHSAVHGASHEYACVLHTHSEAGMAVSAMKCGLLPISQHAMRFYNRLSYHDYEGIALDLDERERLIADLGDNQSMILRNHGFLTAGRTCAEAFSLVFYLEKCARSQIQAMAAGGPDALVYPSPEVCEHTAKQFETSTSVAERDWPGHLRRLDALDPSYRT
ncbi:MAG: class II aldolase/adducin family protein [Alphaproteobacteria bacterium]|nr:class II aldolase/adducin family protein [Alphaproteobacteria bacterium]